MSIVSSVITSVDTQSDGRRRVYESHTDHTGYVHLRQYLTTAIADINAALAAYAAGLPESLKQQEITENVREVTSRGSLATYTTVHSTVNQNLAALRDAYRNSLRVEAIMIGDFLSSLTNAQLQSIFNMTAGAVTTLRANKLTPAATAATDIRNASGE